jgi:ketosteroid isomerase-like protein
MSTLEERVRVLEDIEAIRKLKARYCAACDDNHNAETLGTLFAEDASWEATNMGRADGRPAIQKMLGDVAAAAASATPRTTRSTRSSRWTATAPPATGG